jgi:hypothetical protein
VISAISPFEIYHDRYEAWFVNHNAEKVADLLEGSGFAEQVWVQTLFRPLSQIREPESVRSGSGSGAFVVVRATRS